MKLLKLTTAAMILLLSIAVHATEIEPAHSGNWYDPERNGEGFLVEIGEAVANVFWFTYDAEGNQRFLFGSTKLAENREELELNLYRTSGPVFGPEYDMQDLNIESYGSMTMSFTDCDNAIVEYSVLGTQGELELQRLTAIGDLECTADQGPSGNKIILEKWAWAPDEGGNIRVEGTVRNDSGKTLQTIQIFIEFRNSNDSLLGVDYAFIRPLPLRAGASGTFSMRTFIKAPTGILKIRYGFRSR